MGKDPDHEHRRKVGGDTSGEPGEYDRPAYNQPPSGGNYGYAPGPYASASQPLHPLTTALTHILITATVMDTATLTGVRRSHCSLDRAIGAAIAVVSGITGEDAVTTTEDTFTLTAAQFAAASLHIAAVADIVKVFICWGHSGVLIHKIWISTPFFLETPPRRSSRVPSCLSSHIFRWKQASVR